MNSKSGHSRCFSCDTEYVIGTSHDCGSLIPNIEPSSLKQGEGIPGITEENLLEKNPEVVGKWEFQKDPAFVLATADERVVNNVMRHEYKVLTDEQKHAMKSIKDHGLLFHEYLEAQGVSRELSIAKTKIEEAVFWAIKHITT